MKNLIPTPPRARRVRAGVPDARADWFRIGPVRAEVVGEQPDGDEPATRSSADVYVYEEIGGWWGMTADDFVRDVAALDVDHINVHLNSPGGDAWDGVAMANVLRQHPATVTVWIDGIAASAASVVAMAGDEIIMGIGAQLMVHDAWTVAVGNADDLRKEASVADSVSDAIATAYAARAGGTAAEWRAVMKGEAWYTGPEAVTAKLADRVATDADRGSAGGQQVVPGSSSSSMWDWWDSVASPDRHAATLRALYAHAGRSDAPAPPMPGRPAHQTPAASAGGSNRTQDRSTPVAFSDEQLTTMRQQLGLAEDADEATIVAALTEALDERAEDQLPTTTTAPEGTSVIDDAVLASLRADAAAGRAARDQQLADEREQLVRAAVRDGRIPRARADHWRQQLVADPGARDQLASLAAGLIPVDERGHDIAGAAEAPEQPVSLKAVRESAPYKSWEL